MNLPGIIELARGQARFVRYQDGNLWYSIPYATQSDYTGTYSKHFEFPIPVSDAGGGEFGPWEKGLTLMRWIRKHIEMIKESQNEE